MNISFEISFIFFSKPILVLSLFLHYFILFFFYYYHFLTNRRNCAENVGQPLMNLSEEGLFLVGQEYSREAESKLLFKSQKTVVWRQIGR